MSDGETLWEGEKRSLTAAATGGKMVSAKYRITTEMIYFEAGLLSSKSEQIPLWAVRDVDVNQTMTQKARKIGDVVVHCQHSDYTGREQVTLESVDDPKGIRDLLNRHASEARHAYQQRGQTVHYSGTPATGMPAAEPTPESSSGPAVDIADQIRKLADLKEQGFLTDEEFAAQKAKLLS